jgi:tetraacyldisaccharide 4'-kinase
MLLPAGRLREPLAALKRADVVVITRSESAPTLEAVIARHSPVRIFYAQTRLEAIYRAGKPGEVPSDTLPMGNFARERFFAFCGTGNPSAFFSDARRWGLNLCGEARYRDHHRYSAADAKGIKDQALAAQATALLCTEKDICNLNSSAFEGLPLYCTRISLHLPEAEKFWCAVSDAVKCRRSGMDR